MMKFFILVAVLLVSGCSNKRENIEDAVELMKDVCPEKELTRLSTTIGTWANSVTFECSIAPTQPPGEING